MFNVYGYITVHNRRCTCYLSYSMHSVIIIVSVMSLLDGNKFLDDIFVLTVDNKNIYIFYVQYVFMLMLALPIIVKFTG